MIDIVIKSQECVGCGCLFTAPQDINKKYKEFETFGEDHIEIPKTIKVDGKEQELTVLQKRAIKDIYKAGLDIIFNDIKERKKLNKFELVEEELNGFYKVEIKIEPKYAVVKKTKEELILECPECGMISYKERLRS